MNVVYQNFLAHHGIKGQKWGVRRYQNEDGTLTEEGKTHYYNKHSYRDIEVERSVKKDQPVYTVYRSGGKSPVGYRVSEQNYFQMHREAEREALDWVKKNTAIKDLPKQASRDKKAAEAADAVINSFMYIKLARILQMSEDVYNSERGKRRKN